MKYSVSHWTGRTGNNIQQVANCIMIAERKSNSFEQILEHELIDKFSVDFGDNVDNGHHVQGRFYSWEPIVNCGNKSFDGGNELGIGKEYVYSNMRRVCRDIISPNLKVPTIEPFDDDTLVIHIRGGDIIAVQHQAHNYVQNPLSYYLALIEDFKNVIVVAEPNSDNPVISELRKIERLKFQSSSVLEDYATLLAAKNLATSGVGTFAVSAALCSKNIKNIFTSDRYLTEHLNYTMLYNTDVTVYEIELEDYIPVYPCSWKNDEEQRNLMLNYQLPE